MYVIETNTGGHYWEKQNLVTIAHRRGSYDILKCKGCGLVGKSRTIGLVALKLSYSSAKIISCPGNKLAATRIKITKCTAFGTVFANLVPGSEHDVVEPPANEKSKNDQSGVWVNGVGEKVRVVSGEYITL